MSSRKSEGAFSTLHHIAIVVKDIERTVNYFESLGIGPFQAYPPMHDYTEVDVPDKEAFYNLTIKQVRLGSVVLQLIQPSDRKTIYKDFLDEKGEGVFHLGFVVENVDREESKLRGKGLKVLSRGRRADGTGFTYFDTADNAGVVLLIRQNPLRETE